MKSILDNVHGLSLETVKRGRISKNRSSFNSFIILLKLCLLWISASVAHLAPYDDDDYLISNTDQVNAVQTGGHWEFPCPHIQTDQADKSHPRPDISVSWKHNGDVLIKIKNGDIVLGDRAPTMTSTSRNAVNGLFMVRADFHRYSLYYDEIVGDFSLTITSARERDGGFWECIVESRRGRHKRIRDEDKAEKFLEISGTDPATPDNEPDSWQSPSDDYGHHDQEHPGDASMRGQLDSKPVIDQIPVMNNKYPSSGNRDSSGHDRSVSNSGSQDGFGNMRRQQPERAAANAGHPNYAVQTLHVTQSFDTQERVDYLAETGRPVRKSAVSNTRSNATLFLILTISLLHCWIF